LKQYPLKKCDTISNDDGKKSEHNRLGRRSHEQEQKQDEDGYGHGIEMRMRIGMRTRSWARQVFVRWSGWAASVALIKP